MDLCPALYSIIDITLTHIARDTHDVVHIHVIREGSLILSLYNYNQEAYSLHARGP